jgi:phenylalanyl-tRNA synthetase alpha chain
VSADDRETLAALEGSARAEIARAQGLPALQEVRARWLGRKGRVSALLRGIGELDPARRAERGEVVNALRDRLEACLVERRGELERLATDRALAAGRLDTSLPGAAPPRGHLHPITLVRRDMVRFFTSLGFSIEEGPEVETDYHNFEALNIPPEHPARDEQDTFYVEGGNLLRTHTSNVQIRAMSGREPPLRFVAPGRVYRHDLSPRHSPMFHQIEGFLVDDRVSFGDLKGILHAFARHLMGDGVEVRFRANHFPFTEPSAEMDFRLPGGGWLEWGGCGMIHPRVLERCGIDPRRWQGFAFGMGIDRTALLRFGVPALRVFFENDVRVLEQF